MKITLTKICTILFGMCILLGTFSCQTESLNSEDPSSDADVLARKAKIKAMNWPECESAPAQVVDLYAGQNILVGDVTVEVVGSNYKITYNVTNGAYCLAETHLSVVDAKENFPINNGGNPVIGNFEYSRTHDCIPSYTYTVPMSRGTFIAAHAVVHCVTDVTSDTYAMSLPASADVCVTSKGGPDAYFTIEIAEGNDLSGTYEAWCLDQDARLDNLECFEGDVYSSYEELPEGQFENPQNFGALNWLMNQDFIGTLASEALGNYTFGDIQIAIWRLVDDSVCSDCDFTGPYNNDRIDMLVDMALEHNDFVPSCGDDIVIILVPNDGEKQTILITIPAPCGECSETAFGAGCDFPGNNWFTWFQYGGAS